LSITGGFDVNTAYSFQAYIKDSFNSYTIPFEVKPSFSLINFGAGGKSLAIGGVSSDAGSLEVNLPSYFSSGLQVSSGTLYAANMIETNTYFKSTKGTVNAFGIVGTVNATGWVRAMRITINGTYQNKPITFDIHSRARYPYKMLLRFNGDQNATANTITMFYETSIYWENPGTVVAAYLSSGVCDIYVKKSESYDSISIHNLSYDTNYMDLTIEYFKDVLYGANPPTGYTAAKKLWTDATTACNGMMSTTDKGKVNQLDMYGASAWNELASATPGAGKSTFKSLSTSIENYNEIMIMCRQLGTDSSGNYTTESWYRVLATTVIPVSWVKKSYGSSYNPTGGFHYASFDDSQGFTAGVSFYSAKSVYLWVSNSSCQCVLFAR
jgi:hypothetical protein